MPCSKYKGKQKRACYATNEWTKPVKSNKGGKSGRKSKKK